MNDDGVKTEGSDGTESWIVNNAAEDTASDSFISGPFSSVSLTLLLVFRITHLSSLGCLK